MQRIKTLILGGAACVVLTACGPRYVPVESLSGNHAQSGYYQSGHSQGGYSQQGYTSYGQQQVQSRYGNPHAAGLQAPCAEVFAPCGFMRVVPVYPIYQYTVPTVEETPAVTVEPELHYYEPEPVPVYEPAPVYEPEPVYEPAPYHWPEPEAQVPDWRPLRK